MSARYHTATHLLNQALRQVLGEHVVQKGSNINPERLRFDFPNDRKLTDEEIQKVEKIINDLIQKKLDVYFEEMPKEKALKLAPHSVFTEKYGETVKVYFVGRGKDNFSTEICGGPHVKNTSELGTFKIVKQENVGAGIKRIKAVLK
jgi:alanyl-tRNA synthetase